MREEIMPLMNREHDRFKNDPLYLLEGVKLEIGELEVALQAQSGRIVELLDARWLAALLWAYESDEPRYDEDASPHYPTVNSKLIEVVAGWVTQKHMGDCTQDACTCMRCWGEHLQHKAQWIVAALRGQTEQSYGETIQSA